MSPSSADAFSIPPARRRRRLVSLTPLIDVVFLLLIFFMLASRFAVETRLDLAAGGSGAGYSGPPRLVSIRADGLALNGTETPLAELPAAVGRLMAEPSQLIVLRAEEGAEVQRVVVVLDALKSAGFEKLALVE